MSYLDLFTTIAAIPHGSGNTKALSDFCVRFAKEHGFETRQDRWNNVLIRVPASRDKESEPAVILQGHLDMVCEKEPDSSHDFLKDGLRLMRQGDDLLADGTTLGGDDGIAIAYSLALLEEPAFSHPPLELFFTADEETGMEGARFFDPAWLTGRRLLNLDSEEEGIFIVSSAGGRCITGTLTPTWEPCSLPVYQISVSGLQGGHSGCDMYRGRANANDVLRRILLELPCRLISVSGGQKANAIPRFAQALVAMETSPDAHMLTDLYRAQYKDRDPGLTVHITPASAASMMDAPSSERVLNLWNALPDGIQQMSREIPGLVEASVNLAIVTTAKQRFQITLSLRSQQNTERDLLTDRITALLRQSGAQISPEEGYPAWEYQRSSFLQARVADAYRALYHKDPRFIALHAGLECGLFSEKLPELDAVSLGPDIRDIHTTRERLNLPSAERTWILLKRILETL